MPAKRAGKPTHLLAVPGTEAYQLILLAAGTLRSSRVVISLSGKTGAEEQAVADRTSWESITPSPTDDASRDHARW